MPGCEEVGTDLARHDQQLIELKMVIAEAAWNRSSSGKVLLNERPDDLALEAIFVVDDVVWNSDGLRDGSRVVDVVERATATLHGLGHAFLAGEAALIPELHGEAHHIVALCAKHGRDSRGIDSARHSHRDGLRAHELCV